ncbi:MAG: beta-N-acetylhexosaminidase, partial [Alloprevotella sp.]
MKQKSLLVSLLAAVMFLCSPGSASAQANFDVVPRPLKITPAVEKGDFALNAQTVIVCGKAAEEQTNAHHLQGFITERTGFTPAIVHKAPQTNAIVLSQNLKNDNLEAYHLTVTADRIHINGASAAGTFYGIQTLRKSLPHNSHRGKIIPPKGKQIYIP